MRRLLDYCLKKDQDPHIIGGTMSGHDARELAKEFAASRSASAHLTHPVLHWSISYQQADMQAGLTPEKRGEIAREIFRRHLADDCGKVNAQRIERGLDPIAPPQVDEWDFVVVSHRSADGKENPHDHLVAIRANRCGHVYHAKYSRHAAVSIDRAIEKEYGLTQLPTRERQQSRNHIRPTDQNGYIAKQHNAITAKDQVAHEARVIFDALSPQQRSVPGFAHALQDRGLYLFQEQTAKGRRRYYIGIKNGAHWRTDRLGFKGADAVDRLAPDTVMPDHHNSRIRDR